MSQPVPPLPQQPARPKRHGCFFYGCITALVLVALLAGSGYFGGRYLINKMVAEYTQTAPATLPKSEISADEMSRLKLRIQEFSDAAEKGQPLSITLNEKELNALLASGDNELQNRIYIGIDGDELNGQVSIPLDNFGLSIARDRYLNGKARLKASLNNDVLMVHMQSLEIAGQQVPDYIMQALRKENIAKDVYKNEKTAETLRKIESITVKDNLITVKARDRAQ
jgi:hypothetical protein